MAQYIEQFLPGIRENGLRTQKTVDFSGAPSVALPSGTTINGATATPNNITSTSANALTVGANGTTNPVLQIDASTASVATGIKVKGAAAAGGVAITVITSGTNENLTVDSAGSGTVGLNTVNTSAGQVVIGNATNLGGLGVNGPTVITSASATSLTVGANGSTTPVFQIDASTGSQIAGLKLTGAVTGGNVALQVIDTGSNAGLLLNAKGSGVVAINNASTTAGIVNIGNSTSKQGIAVQGQILATVAAAGGLRVGPNGSTNPTIQVDTSVASAVTGIKIQGQAAGTAPIVSVISSDSALGMVLQALTTTNSVTINDTLAAATNPLIAGIATDTITGGVTDAYTGGLRLSPTINAASALTVTRLNYIDIVSPVLGGAGPAAVTDAAVFRFGAAAGTHKAVDAGTTKTSPGTVTQWVKINVNGTLAYIPSYSSKTS